MEFNYADFENKADFLKKISTKDEPKELMVINIPKSLDASKLLQERSFIQACNMSSGVKLVVNDEIKDLISPCLIPSEENSFLIVIESTLSSENLFYWKLNKDGANTYSLEVGGELIEFVKNFLILSIEENSTGKSFLDLSNLN